MNTLIKHLDNQLILQKCEDEVLVAKLFEERNVLIFEVLYKRYETTIYNKCLYFLKSEDLAADFVNLIFSEVFKNIKKSKNHKFSTWLFSTTYMMCVDYLHTTHKIEKIDKVAKNDLMIPDNHIHIEVSDAILFRLKVKRLAKAMELVDPEDKAILLLKYQDDVSEIELASLLDENSETIKNRLRKAKARIIETYNEL